MKHFFSDTSNLERMEWSSNKLSLFFRDGSQVNYLDIPEGLAEGLRTSASAGSFLHRYVKGNFGYIKIKDSNEKEKIKHLQQHLDSTVGLWATDRPDLIPEDIKHLFFQITNESVNP